MKAGGLTPEKIALKRATGEMIKGVHAVFVAWCKAAGEREWSNKGLAKAMQDKGYEKKASDGMQWLGIELVRDVHDFVDEHGDPRPFSIDEDGGSPPAQAPPSASPWDEVDDLPP